MRIRSVLCLVTALSTSSFMLVGSDLACTTHDAQHQHHAAALVTQHGDAGHSASHSDAESTESGTDAPSPHESPPRPDCCPAMTSCSTAMLAVVVAVTPHTPSLTAGGWRLAVRAPKSRYVAPEPPPPKA